MAYLQVKDILNRAVEFHKMLVDFYSKIENTSGKEAVKLLVDYMARHEEILKVDLSKITSEQEKQITDTWMKYEPEYATCNCFEDLKIDENSGVDDIIDAGLKLNQCLINLYHQMTEVSPTEQIRLLFSNLETMEIAQKKQLARMRGM